MSWRRAALAVVLVVATVSCQRASAPPVAPGADGAPASASSATRTASPPETPVRSAEASSLSRLRPGGRFVVLDDPVFLQGGESALGDDELVLGLEWRGEARAYPVRMMRYHHIANDTVRGVPVLVTY